MIHGAWVTCTIASGKTSTVCDLGRVYEKVMVYLPTLTASAANTIYVQGAKYTADSYKNIYTYVPSGGAIVQMAATANCAGDCMVVYPIGGFQFIKFVCGETQTTVTFYCQGVRS